MIRLRKSYMLERLVYVAIWLIVFLAPLVIVYWVMSLQTEQSFSWQGVIQVWVYSILPFFLLFCLHDIWLAPYFLLRKKYGHYVIAVFILLCFFIWFDMLFFRRGLVGHFPVNMREQMIEHRGREWERRERSFTRVPDFQTEDLSQDDLSDRLFSQDLFQEESLRNSRPMRGREPKARLQPFLGIMLFPTILHLLIAVLMIGFNIAIKLLFKSLQDEEAMKEMERRKLQSELEYLKYQINPHFFMNTLNNIHALVDIDKSQAKKTIVELSKMMRYVLYEANNKTIPLAREILFLSNYVELMKLRYIEKVNVRVSFPKDIPAVKIPPLLYISFIENAFKHGVSYQSVSLIYVAMQIEDESLVFTCSNTNNGKSEEQHKGIGLDNVQKRLKLLYGSNYTLSINESLDSFNVLLIIPLI